jgi:hypothetical protein
LYGREVPEQVKKRQNWRTTIFKQERKIPPTRRETSVVSIVEKWDTWQRSVGSHRVNYRSPREALNASMEAMDIVVGIVTEEAMVVILLVDSMTVVLEGT